MRIDPRKASSRRLEQVAGIGPTPLCPREKNEWTRSTTLSSAAAEQEELEREGQGVNPVFGAPHEESGANRPSIRKSKTALVVQREPLLQPPNRSQHTMPPNAGTLRNTESRRNGVEPNSTETVDRPLMQPTGGLNPMSKDSALGPAKFTCEINFVQSDASEGATINSFQANLDRQKIAGTQQNNGSSQETIASLNANKSSELYKEQGMEDECHQAGVREAGAREASLTRYRARLFSQSQYPVTQATSQPRETAAVLQFPSWENCSGNNSEEDDLLGKYRFRQNEDSNGHRGGPDCLQGPYSESFEEERSDVAQRAPGTAEPKVSSRPRPRPPPKALSIGRRLPDSRSPRHKPESQGLFDRHVEHVPPGDQLNRNSDWYPERMCESPLEKVGDPSCRPEWSPPFTDPLQVRTYDSYDHTRTPNESGKLPKMTVYGTGIMDQQRVSPKRSASAVHRRSNRTFTSSAITSESPSQSITEMQAVTIPKNGRAREQLYSLKEKITAFERRLLAETEQRRNASELKLRVIKNAVQQLRKTLDTEVHRRAEAMQLVQQKVKHEIISLEKSAQSRAEEQRLSMEKAVARVSAQITAAESTVRNYLQDQDQRLETMKDEVRKTEEQIQNLRARVIKELNVRRQRADTILGKVGEMEQQIITKVQFEQSMRERDKTKLLERLEDMEKKQAADREEFQDQLAHKFMDLKTALQNEAIAREQADDDLVQALNHYTTALQSALRIANVT